MPDTVWLHRDCGGRIFWDMSGGFCERCEEESLDEDDAEQVAREDVTSAGWGADDA